MLRSPAVTDLELIDYTEWYARPSRPHIGDSVDRRLIEAGEHVAAGGPDLVVRALQRHAEAIVDSLADARPDAAIPLASIPGSAVALADFLRTRIVEIVVHGDDMAASVGAAVPPFGSHVWAVAIDVLTHVATFRHGPATVMRAFARPARCRVALEVF